MSANSPLLKTFARRLGFGPERNRVYVPDRMGRLGQGHWIDRPDPFGRLEASSSPEPEFDLRRPFDLERPIGRDGDNRRTDVAKLEGLLGVVGDLDVARTDGPTGYFGERLDSGIRRFQRKSGLKVDGSVRPGGPTIRALHDAATSRVAAMANDEDDGDPGGRPPPDTDAPNQNPPPELPGFDPDRPAPEPPLPQWLIDIFKDISGRLRDASDAKPSTPEHAWPGGIRGRK